MKRGRDSVDSVLEFLIIAFYIKELVNETS